MEEEMEEKEMVVLVVKWRWRRWSMAGQGKDYGCGSLACWLLKEGGKKVNE